MNSQMVYNSECFDDRIKMLESSSIVVIWKMKPNEEILVTNVTEPVLVQKLANGYFLGIIPTLDV